jgi:DNA processing protein
MYFTKEWTIEDLLTLSFYKGINSKKIIDIISNYISYERLIKANLPDKLKLIFNQDALFDNNINREKAKYELDHIIKKGYNLYTFIDEDYPTLLKEIFDPPAFLFVKGKLQQSNAASISIVGTRRNSVYGRLATEKFAQAFVYNNIIVTSGLANGIDTIAHQTVVKNNGITYAIIASGIDKLSPSLSVKNSESIVESGGAIISTYHSSVSAKPGYFLQRNRIISGISKATLIIESAGKGGSLWTAKFSADQNREVFALPGRISDEKSVGTNKLILDNLAQIAISPEFILEELGFKSKTSKIENILKFENPDEEKVYKLLNQNPTHIDELIDKLDYEMSQLLVILLNLEFSNKVRQLPGKHYITTN